MSAEQVGRVLGSQHSSTSAFRVVLDERVPLLRPRWRGQPAYAAIEARVLQRVLREPTRESGHGPVGAPPSGPEALALELMRFAV